MTVSGSLSGSFPVGPRSTTFPKAWWTLVRARNGPDNPPQRAT